MLHLALWLSLVAASQVAAGSPPDSAPVIDGSARLEQIRHQHDLPGIAAIGIHDGKTIVLGACGRRRADQQLPMTVNDRFHLGSCGKAMTATMIATLVEDGTLSWDTTIAAGLADLASEINGEFHQVTLLQLLQHRGGIAERKNGRLNRLLMSDLAHLVGSPRQQRYDAIPFVLEDKPTTTPGQSMEYSNYGYMVAAAMAEIASEQSWQELMTEHVFSRLGMASAGFAMPGKKGMNDEPRGHKRDRNQWIPMEPGVDVDLPECIAPAGLIHCSLQDWAKFVQAHLDGENGKGGLLTAATYRLLHRPPDGEPSMGEGKYACGWGVAMREWSNYPLYTHSGSNGYWYSVICASPSMNAAAMTVCNAAGPGAEAALQQVIVEMFTAMDLMPRASVAEPASTEAPDKGG